MTKPPRQAKTPKPEKQPAKTSVPGHELFQQVYDESAVGVIAINAAGIVGYVNAVALKIQGSDLLNQRFFDFYQDPSEGKGVQASIEKMEEITDRELMFGKQPGRDNWVFVSSAVRRDNEGRVLTYLFIRDISVLKKRERLFSYLNTAAEELAKARNTQNALDKIAQLIVPSFASWFTIDLLKDGNLELLLLKHSEPDKIEWARQYRKNYPPDPNGNTGSAVIIKTGKHAFVPLVTDEMIVAIVPDPVQLDAVRQIGLKSVIMAPVYNREKIIGIVNFISSDVSRLFDEADLEFALNFTNLIGLALENARLNEAASNEIDRRERSEAELRFLTNAVPHKIWTANAVGQATYYNKRWYEYMGVGDFDELREKVWDIIHPDDREEAAKKWPEAMQNGLETELEHRFRRHDGMYRWHLSRYTAHRDEAGQIALWVGTSTDIHEQKEARLETERANNDLSSVNEELAALNEELSATNEELAAVNEEAATTNEELIETQVSYKETIEELAASSYRFRFLLNAVPQQVWTAKPEGALDYVNDVVCDDFGFSSPDVVEYGWRKFIHPEDMPVCVEKWTTAIATGTEYVNEVRLLFHDGVYRWHLARAIPLIEEGNIRMWIGTNTDIELQKANEQRKDEFLSIASHELRTPLTSIKAFNQLLQRVKDPEKLEPFIKKSANSINRLERLINDLLDVTKINAGKMTYNMERFDFGKMMAETVESARLIAYNHDITIENDANIAYTGDYHRLEQVVNNLISNAIKYSPNSNRVIVRASAEPENVLVSVQDFGIGIAPAHIGKLFDRYYRVDNTAMRFEGLGLGLFITSEILKRHRGTFWIESEVGKGSTFFFRLPLKANS